jgi:protein SCO1/2
MSEYAGFFRRVMKSPFTIAFVIGMVAIYVVREASIRRRSAPPPLVHVGPWSMQDHTGKTFGSTDLKGKVYVASFFFTKCPTICPKLTESIIDLSKRFSGLEDKVHFVGVTVDPANDTPEVLSAYMKKYGIEGPNWSYLTSTPKGVYDIVAGQMKLHVGDKQPFAGEGAQPDSYEINHIAELVLFDQNGDLRAKFGTDPASLAALERSAKFLLEAAS